MVNLARVLKQSDIQFLSVKYSDFDPVLESRLGLVLSAVKWYALKSLELSGDNLDSWMNL